MEMPLNAHLAHVQIIDLKPDLADWEKRSKLIQLGSARREAMADADRIVWTCLHVERGFERVVENVLIRGRVNCYLPCWPGTTTARRRNARKPQFRPGGPVYPSYILVQCAFLRDAFLGLEAIRHVYNVIGGPFKAAIVPDDSVRNFKSMVDNDMKSLQEADARIKPGDEALVKCGPWVDHVVDVIDVLDGEATVDVTLFGKCFPMTMPIAFLREL